MRVKGFKDIGTRIIDHDAAHYFWGTNLPEINLRFYPLLFLHDQEPMYYSKQKTAYMEMYLRDMRLDGRSIVLTSEKNSSELDAFCQAFGSVPCYWFSNAALALEWYGKEYYRLPHAGHKHLRYKFSCLNRLISHQRQYRPIIAAHLLNTVDHDKLQLSCSMVDPTTGKKASQLHAASPPNHKELVQRFSGHRDPLLLNIKLKDVKDGVISNASYDTSRDYFIDTFCHVVTETLFYEKTLHLTEKSFRPMVNERPFILVGPPRSLEYLRSYGFKTFDDYWDESYDIIDDPDQRLDKIMNLITEINNWSLDDMSKKLASMSSILQHNRHVFLNLLPAKIREELINNLSAAVFACKKKKLTGHHIKSLESMTEQQYNDLMLGEMEEDLYSNPMDAINNFDSNLLRVRAATGIRELRQLGIEIAPNKDAMVQVLKSLLPG